MLSLLRQGCQIEAIEECHKALAVRQPEAACNSLLAKLLDSENPASMLLQGSQIEATEKYYKALAVRPEDACQAP